MFNLDVSPDGSTVVNKKAVVEFKKLISKQICEEVKDQILTAVLPSLGPKNFEGEAVNYLMINNMPLTKQDIELYSKEIFKEFVKNVDNLITYSEEQQCILISPYIVALEYGDLYRPVLKTITRAIEASYPVS